MTGLGLDGGEWPKIPFEGTGFRDWERDEAVEGDVGCRVRGRR